MTVVLETRRASRAPIYGSRGMVVSGHAAASLAGVAILKRGGSVIDATIAASSVLSVVLGHATSIGGDCFLLFREAKSGRTVGLNASGVAPSAAEPARFPDGMKKLGPLAAVVPGLVSAWQELHRRHGKLPWSDLFVDAIDLAESHTVSHILASRIGDHHEALAADPGCAATFLPGGNPVRIGDTLRQPALAATLRRIAARGADEFYRGETAQRIGAYFEERGGLIRATDLAAYQPLWVDPIASEYRGHRVQVMPPNSYGVLLLMQLNGLSALESCRLTEDPARQMGYQMSAMKAAFESGVSLVADPTALPDAPQRLLGADMVARMRAAVLHRAQPTPIPDRGGTSCLLVADSAGNAVSMVQSVFNVFGAAFLDPQTGILFNNRAQSFSRHAGRPNSIGPGKRPPHTLCPVMAERGGQVRFALASPGGLSQTLTNVQVLTHLIDSGLDVAAAVEAPRWCNTRVGDFLIEHAFSEAAIGVLAEMGHRAARGDDGYFYGSAKAIEFLPSGNLAGAADHRREGFALGY